MRRTTVGLDSPRTAAGGEIRWVDLDPARGVESNKRRPGVIVSNDGANTTASRRGRGVVTIVPVTSNVERIYPFQVLLTAEATGLARDSKAHVVAPPRTRRSAPARSAGPRRRDRSEARCVSAQITAIPRPSIGGRGRVGEPEGVGLVGDGGDAAGRRLASGLL